MKPAGYIDFVWILLLRSDWEITSSRNHSVVLTACLTTGNLCLCSECADLCLFMLTFWKPFVPLLTILLSFWARFSFLPVSYFHPLPVVYLVAAAGFWGLCKCRASCHWTHSYIIQWRKAPNSDSHMVWREFICCFCPNWLYSMK